MGDTDVEVLMGNQGTGAFCLVHEVEYAGSCLMAGGPDVGGVHPGDPVAVDPTLEYGARHACRRSWVHLCERLGAYGVPTDVGFRSVAQYCAGRVRRCPEFGATRR